MKRERTEKLQQICTAVHDGKKSKALALVKTSPELRNSSLAAHLKNQERDSRLMHSLNQALLQQKYSQAVQLIQEAEQSGQASAEILKLKELPYALQALQLFCVRMPWEDASTLKKNWSFLAQHEDILDESPAFQTFRQEQFNLLKSFRQEADQEKTALLLARIDGFCAGGRTDQAWKTAVLMKRSFPMHVFSRMAGVPGSRTQYFNDLLASRQTMPETAGASFELALALHWNRLPNADRKAAGRLLAGLARKETISGILLDAACRNSIPALLDAVAAWQKVAGQNQTLPHFLRTALLDQMTPEGAFPGISAVLYCMKQYGSAAL